MKKKVILNLIMLAGVQVKASQHGPVAQKATTVKLVFHSVVEEAEYQQLLIQYNSLKTSKAHQQPQTSQPSLKPIAAPIDRRVKK